MRDWYYKNLANGRIPLILILVIAVVFLVFTIMYPKYESRTEKKCKEAGGVKVYIHSQLYCLRKDAIIETK